LRKYTYELYSTGGHIRVPKDVGIECKRLGINGDDILAEYRKFTQVGMKVTYLDGAMQAIYKRKQKMYSGGAQ
jgi:hypothetical protein